MYDGRGYPDEDKYDLYLFIKYNDQGPSECQHVNYYNDPEMFTFESLSPNEI